MKNLVKFFSVLVSLIVLVLAQKTLAQDIAQIQYFQLYTLEQNDGKLRLVGDFYAYEDSSLYLGSGSIEYVCSTDAYTIDEIVDVPDEVVVNGQTYTGDELAAGIGYILDELIVYSTYQDWEQVFPEWQPDALYNLDWEFTNQNRNILNGFAEFEQPCPTYLTFLPVVVK